MQGSGNIRVPSTAQEGGVIKIEVGSASSSVGVSLGGPNTTRYDVPPSGVVSVPVPPGATGGSVVSVSIGKGLNAKVFLVEIVANSP